MHTHTHTHSFQVLTHVHIHLQACTHAPLAPRTHTHTCTYRLPHVPTWAGRAGLVTWLHRATLIKEESHSRDTCVSSSHLPLGGQQLAGVTADSQLHYSE